MCGIICEICYSKHSSILQDDKNLLRRLKKRGPDSSSIKIINVTDQCLVTFYGTVLWMQGTQLTPQPIENELGVLLFNGDIFNEEWDTNKLSDTQTLLNKLSHTKGDEHQIWEVIRNLKGPFSIIYFCKETNMLYFTRDKIGRNSLLFHYDDDKILISSVLDRKYACVEISAQSIYKFNVITKKTTTYSWDGLDIHNGFEFAHNIWKQVINEKTCDNIDIPCDSKDQNNIIAAIESISANFKNKETILEELLKISSIKQKLYEILRLLEKSVKIRIERQPNKCKSCIKDKISMCDHSAVGILFSGGLDCTVLACLANKYVPDNQSIDLMNVAFQKDNNCNYEVPDRITGKQSLEELKIVCPKRKWIFREINVSKEELATIRQDDIGNLLYPLQTILDENLGSALWFAARGLDATGSTSLCRIVLLGSGADELFGGYTRHRNMYKRKGWNGLKNELQYDCGRISYRNLARDNRIICDHGRQPRMPYLDDDFSDYVKTLEPWFRCFPTEKMEIGIGDKYMLRLVAFYLGLKQVASFPKRALQFGSRIANKKDKGDDVSAIFK